MNVTRAIDPLRRAREEPIPGEEWALPAVRRLNEIAQTIRYQPPVRDDWAWFERLISVGGDCDLDEAPVCCKYVAPRSADLCGDTKCARCYDQKRP